MKIHWLIKLLYSLGYIKMMNSWILVICRPVVIFSSNVGIGVSLTAHQVWAGKANQGEKIVEQVYNYVGKNILHKKLKYLMYLEMINKPVNRSNLN